MRKVKVYHVWAKTPAGNKIQADIYREPKLGRVTRIGNMVCKVIDYAEYEIADRRSH